MRATTTEVTMQLVSRVIPPRRTATLATTVTLLVLGALGLGGAATASAATATLSIAGSQCEGFDGRIHDYLLRVAGDVDGSYPSGFRADVGLWGDDEWYDDKLLGPVSETFGSWATGYWVYLCVDSSTLDEDWGEDEVYARVSICVPGSGVCAENARSNVIERHF
jgi:hypothetical protein